MARSAVADLNALALRRLPRWIAGINVRIKAEIIDGLFEGMVDLSDQMVAFLCKIDNALEEGSQCALALNRRIMVLRDEMDRLFVHVKKRVECERKAVRRFFNLQRNVKQRICDVLIGNVAEVEIEFLFF